MVELVRPSITTMKPLLCVCVAALLLGCRMVPLTYSGGDGSSKEQAVIIRGARDTQAGIAAENAWIRQRYPGSQKTMQALETAGGKQYDVIKFTTADGQTRIIYFDITDFFGK